MTNDPCAEMDIFYVWSRAFDCSSVSLTSTEHCSLVLSETGVKACEREIIVEIYIFQDTTGISAVFPFSILPGKVCHSHTSEGNNISSHFRLNSWLKIQYTTEIIPFKRSKYRVTVFTLLSVLLIKRQTNYQSRLT